jgi:hypothetical protein
VVPVQRRRTSNAGQYQTDRGPFTNKNVTHDVVANLTTGGGSHAMKAGFYYQNSFKPQSIFGSFNSAINFNDNSSNPVRHRVQLRQRGDRRVQQLHAGLEVRDSGVALPQRRVLRAGQLEGRQQVHARLRRALLLADPQWDESLQASNFLPSEFDRNNAARLLHAGVHRRRTVLGPAPRGMDPRSSRRGRRQRSPTPSKSGSSARLTPDSNRLQRRVPGGQGITGPAAGRRHVQGPRRASASVYDIPGKATFIFRGGWGILLRPARATWCSNDRQRAGVLNSSVHGPVQDSQRSERPRSRTRRSALNPDGRSTSSREGHAVERRPAEEAVRQLHVRPGLRRLEVG